MASLLTLYGAPHKTKPKNSRDKCGPNLNAYFITWKSLLLLSWDIIIVLKLITYRAARPITVSSPVTCPIIASVSVTWLFPIHCRQRYISQRIWYNFRQCDWVLIQFGTWSCNNCIVQIAIVLNYLGSNFLMDFRILFCISFKVHFLQLIYCRTFKFH